MKSPLSGKTALVTGASSGLGRALALELGRRGAGLFLVARREAELRSVTEEIRAAGGQAEFYACDLRPLPAVYDLVDIVLSRLKRLDILVNNAGVGFQAPLLGTKRSEISEAIEINLLTPIYLTQAALPALLRAAPSEIVNVAALSGLHASAEATVYCATKFGLVGFSRALALELQPAGIRVTTFCPGRIDTPVLDRFASRPGPEELIAPPDAARILVQTLETPPEILYGEIAIRHR
jgi:NAD(P)-dependent dehydrogenase (short-subunit alcohol dehydrogenase family)